MANPANIAYLTKYQMRVLYYKCKEGATHEEIAAKLGRDVNTVQYHMTRIYAVLEIRKPGKSRAAMESELQNEIGPLIREMFRTIEDVKTWAPVVKDRSPEEKEDPVEGMEEPGLDDTQPRYIPPRSVQRVLGNADNQPAAPEVLQSPPPGRRRRNWRPVAGFAVSGLLIVIVWIAYPWIRDLIRGPDILPVPTSTPQPIAASTVPPLHPSALPADTPLPPISQTPPIQIMVDPKDGMVLVRIPAGEFEMGSSRVEDPQALDEELPQHVVYLDDYWIDRTEVTNAQYAMCVAEGACTVPANSHSATRGSYYGDSQYADYPVVYVSWSQAAAYCAWADRRLPTEAEWEKAARGPAGSIYPWGNTFDGTLANYCDVNCRADWKDDRFDDGYVDTSPVGEYPAGASMYGMLDMAGNAYEWVADWFAPYTRGSQTNPTGPDTGQEKIIRGGAWGDDPAHVRTSIRSRLNGESWMDFIGFRCAR